MSEKGSPKDWNRSGAAARLLSRRRFLSGLGAMAGAGALAPLLAGRRTSHAERLETSRPMLGTWMRVVVRGVDPSRAERAIANAFAAVRTVDEQMSVHRADSQLSRANAAAGHAAVGVDPAVLEVVARACDNARRSGGIYDPTVLPLMRLYGFYGEPRTSPPDAREVDRVLARMGWRDVHIDRAAGTLALLRPGAGLDLGSIGKGWAVDRAVDALRAEGVRDGLVDLGGNVYGLGTPGDGAEGWSVGAFHPVTARLDHVFVLHDTAVATSGNSEQTRTLGPIRIGHLFDARRGRPANGHLSATVHAQSGVEADGRSTTAFLVGPDQFHGYPGVIDCYFIG
jgi:thiamine biosynthesis lipoprotein